MKSVCKLDLYIQISFYQNNKQIYFSLALLELSCIGCCYYQQAESWNYFLKPFILLEIVWIKWFIMLE